MLVERALIPTHAASAVTGGGCTLSPRLVESLLLPALVYDVKPPFVLDKEGQPL
jgi:hypothetical protein